MKHIRDADYFEPSTGYFRAAEVSGGWEIVGNDGLVGFVPTGPNKRPWQSVCDAMLLAGSPEMIDTLVRVHNDLNVVERARRIQGSIRGCLVKVVGSSDRIMHMRDHRLILPPENSNG